MGFDASKVRDEATVLDPDAASLNRWIPDAAASMVGMNAAGVRLTGFSAAQERRSLADVLVPTKPQMGLDSSFLRSAASIPASGTLPRALRPGGAYGPIISALAEESLRNRVAKFGSLAVVESQASAALNASTVRSVADISRNLRSLEKSTRRWPSMYNGALGNAGFKQVSAMQQTLAGQYAGHFTQVKKTLDVQSANIETQAVRGLGHAHESQLRPMVYAYISPLFDAIRKIFAGFAMPAQRIGEWIKGVVRPFGKLFEWLHREIERWLRDPYGNFVPFWNVRLYRLAQSAYEGDYVARARFLDVIGADGSPENVLMIEELLKPTFDPQRLDRRVAWEQMDPLGARRWLRRRLDGLKLSAWKEEQERKNGEQPYEEDSQVVKAITSDVPELEFVEFELREDERALYEQLRSVLPEQQYWFCWYRAQDLTYEEIAARMGVAPGTVKAHAYFLRRNPTFLEVPVWQAQERFKRKYQEKYEAYEEGLRKWKADERAAVKEGEPAPPKSEEPAMGHAVVDDITVERLADILDETPRGVVSVQDELSGWVLAMNQYKAGGKGADRQFWLRVWSNSPVKADRKSRKIPVVIAQPWISVVGSIQPEILPGMDIGRNDGMMDRFLYSYPEPQRMRHTDDEVSVAAEHAILELYGELTNLKMPESDGEPFPGTVPMTEEAWQVFKELADKLSEEAHGLGFPGRLRGAWSKLEAYLARLSLILALSRVTGTDERERVEARDVVAASLLVGYFKAHAQRVFAELHGADPMDSLAVALKRFLEGRGGRWEGKATELWDALSTRQVQGLPRNPDNLAVKVLAIASRSKTAMRAERGWRGKNRVLRLQLPKNGVGSVGGVGNQDLATNTANADLEDSSENAATITRDPDVTPPLSSEEWEEV